MLRNDKWLLQHGPSFISDFQPSQSGRGRISSGLSSAGYDITLAATGLVYLMPNPTENVDSALPFIDPKDFDFTGLTVPVFIQEDPETKSRFFLMEPHSYVLGHSKEYFQIPDDTQCIVLGKSTYARCGLFINTTPGEPGWEGQWTLELANLTPLPLRVYLDEGIAQVLFFEIEPPEVTYADRNGKYQKQLGTTPARIQSPGLKMCDFCQRDVIDNPDMKFFVCDAADGIVVCSDCLADAPLALDCHEAGPEDDSSK